MKSYRDKPEYKVYKILDELLADMAMNTRTDNSYPVNGELFERANNILDEWASRELKAMADNMEDLPESKDEEGCLFGS